MLCLGCERWGDDLCRICRRNLIEAPDRLLPSGLLVRSCFEHTGVAKAIVHAFKYRGSDRAGWLLARALVSLLPPAGTLVPLPRVSWRTITYGVDPAQDLASKVSALSGIPVWMGLQPPLHSSPQAGRARTDRHPPAFTSREEPPSDLILLDDVVTTGRTLMTAQQALANSVLANSVLAKPVLLALSATSTSD